MSSDLYFCTMLILLGMGSWWAVAAAAMLVFATRESMK